MLYSKSLRHRGICQLLSSRGLLIPQKLVCLKPARQAISLTCRCLQCTFLIAPQPSFPPPRAVSFEDGTSPCFPFYCMLLRLASASLPLSSLLAGSLDGMGAESCFLLLFLPTPHTPYGSGAGLPAVQSLPCQDGTAYSVTRLYTPFPARSVMTSCSWTKIVAFLFSSEESKVTRMGGGPLFQYIPSCLPAPCLHQRRRRNDPTHCPSTELLGCREALTPQPILH